jgi:hypothetical protein
MTELDPSEVLDEARKLKEVGLFEAALEKHLWVHHESLRVCSAFRGVRLSFALGYWKDLANEYPPALNAMREIRDRNLEAIRSGNALGQCYLDAVALNRELEDHNLNAELFEALVAFDKAKAEKLFPFVFDSLVCSKAWRTAREFIPNPVLKAEELVASLEEHLTRFPYTSELGPAVRSGAVGSFWRNLKMLMEVLVGNGETELAEEARRHSLAAVSSEVLRAEIELVIAGTEA